MSTFIKATTESGIYRMMKDYDDAGFTVGNPWFGNSMWNCMVEEKSRKIEPEEMG